MNGKTIRKDRVKKRTHPGKADRIPWQKSMGFTLLLIVLMALASFLLTWRINVSEEKRSFDRLQEEAEHLILHIQNEARDDREQLRLIALMAGGFSDLTTSEFRRILRSYQTGGMISRIELLLPDDTVITADGRMPASGVLSFQEQAALGEHISSRETDLGSEDSFVVRSYVPVVRDGETVAVLYGVIEMDELPGELVSRPYSGEAAIYLIEGESGDFLVDTWHEEPGGNIWELGERQMAPGYDHEQLKEGLTEGETGYVVFVSETSGERMYFYFEPVGINDWRLALSVPESVVFASAHRIQNQMYGFLCFEAVCFALYFAWMLRYVRQVTGEKQRRLDTIQYIYDVESLLFNALDTHGKLRLALGKVGHITGSERVCLWIRQQTGSRSFFSWDREEGQKAPREWAEKTIAGVLAYLQKGHPSLQALKPGCLREWLPECDFSAGDTMMAIPVKGTDGVVQGILACCNPIERQADPALLKSVEFSFAQFCQNLNAYLTAKEQGERDLLCGLYNRNRYETDLPRYRSQSFESLACVYVDVNGLHELNNREGHEAGDRMLQEVAQTLREIFGEGGTYRIGGDEFLAFLTDTDEETPVRLCREMEEKLKERNIHVSVGAHWEKDRFSLDAVVKTAERNMYAAKKAYYEQACHDRRRRR